MRRRNLRRTGRGPANLTDADIDAARVHGYRPAARAKRLGSPFQRNMGRARWSAEAAKHCRFKSHGRG